MSRTTKVLRAKFWIRQQLSGDTTAPGTKYNTQYELCVFSMSTLDPFSGQKRRANTILILQTSTHRSISTSTSDPSDSTCLRPLCITTLKHALFDPKNCGETATTPVGFSVNFFHSLEGVYDEASPESTYRVTLSIGNALPFQSDFGRPRFLQVNGETSW